MRLKEDFVAQVVDDTQFLIPIGADGYQGVVRSNRTAAFIVDCLSEDTTEAAIVDKMCAKYDVPRETVAADVKEILDTLRKIGALEE